MKKTKLRAKPKKLIVSDKKLLALLREVTLLRARDKCEYPNCTVRATQLHPHHYFNKKNQSVRYDPLNIIVLCHIHHTSGNDAAHLDPDWKEKWLKSGKRPEGWLEELTARKNQIVKNNAKFKEEWYQKLLLMRDELLIPF